MSERDLSPIDQQWVQQYADQCNLLADSLPPGELRYSVLRRAECCLDLLEAWQKRNWPIDEQQPHRRP